MTWQKNEWRMFRSCAPRISPLLTRLPGGSRLKQLLGRLVRRQCLHALPNPITVHDVIMYWHPQISNDALELGLRDYERDTRILCQKLLHSGMTMVDVGAHIGYYSLLAAKLVGEEGKVYAFEPDPLNYSLLKKKYRGQRTSEYYRSRE